MTNAARQDDSNVFEEIRRVFALQQAHQWKMKATSAEERKARLEKLKAAVESRGDEIVAAVLKDTRKPEAEIRVTEYMGVMGNIQKNIDNLDEWMKPVEVVPSMNENDEGADRLSEARGVCLVLGPWNFPLGLALRPACSGCCRRQLLHRQALRPVPGDR